MWMDRILIVMQEKEYCYSSDYRRCIDINVKSMNWTSCSKMSRVSVLLCSVSLNNKIKQWAFTLLDLVLWQRYLPVKLAHLLQYPIQFFRSLILSLSVSLNYSCGEAVRRVRSPFHSRCDTQLRRVITGTFLHRIQHVLY